MNTIAVRKLDHNGVLKLEYHGEILERGATWVCLRALFNFEQADLGFVIFRRGDVFIEWFYTDRWYNIFQVNDGDTGELKGWYCNITRPAVMQDGRVAAEDLALDVFVKPDGEILILDEDEFAALELPTDERAAAWNAVETLRQATARREKPFQLLAAP